MTKKNVHHHEIRVYYEDTDALGIVYHANYIKFAERARTEWLRTIDFNHSKLLKDHLAAFVVYRLEIDYHAPAHIDDLIEVETRITDLTRATLMMDQVLMVEGEVKATVKAMLACVNPKGKPIRWPPTLYAMLQTGCTPA